MNATLAQTRHLLKSAERMLEGLDDSHRALEPQPGIKTAGWLIGHLAVTGDFARKLYGRPPMCPVEWRTAFNPGSQPSGEANTYAPMTTLTTAFREVYADLAAAAAESDPFSITVENPFAPARAAFPTAGEFLAYLMTGHLAYHLGQLVAWRAAAGLGRLR
jgi:hypothetical protein